ncbi:hypothetical protein ARSQ2_01109 [Arsenophonus endosymbiont of Bemisia tabaci Q2]|nr:DUF488 family protein [Arsenophonus endosymbiont of Bemisia tabaci]CAA2929996.1 hypothetical protein ARSQ2_01109 [Arsenophonus endosymbiont of Bemisia tabaci Q2]
MIICKRIYADKRGNNGYRVLVDRIWPRSIKKQDLRYDEWNKNLAPSNNLRKWFHKYPENFTQFKRLSFEKLENNPDSWQYLLLKVKSDCLILLFSRKDEDNNNAIVLKSFLKKNLIRFDYYTLTI